MKKETIKKYYCRLCGTRMLVKKIGAEKYYFYGTTGHKLYIYYAYSDETGKRQYVYHYVCPNKKRFFNKHDDFVEDKIITF